MVPPIVRLTDVWAVRGGNVALRSIAFELPRGARVGVFGPGASGKTTLLKLLSGLWRPSRGELCWSEGPGQIGMVFQRDALFDSLTLLRNVELPLRGMAGAEPSARAAIQAVGLSPVDLGKHPAELSGGMRKRAGIARALCAKPPVKLYDEPSAGLDPDTEREILSLLWQSHDAQGLTVVATSDPRELWAQCDLAIVLEGGRLVAFGAAAAVATSTEVQRTLGMAA
jgi:phospholipid/cholesterol/gamma-HCH transport system ATP-binding protein